MSDRNSSSSHDGVEERPGRLHPWRMRTSPAVRQTLRSSVVLQTSGMTPILAPMPGGARLPLPPKPPPAPRDTRRNGRKAKVHATHALTAKPMPNRRRPIRRTRVIEEGEGTLRLKLTGGPVACRRDTDSIGPDLTRGVSLRSSGAPGPSLRSPSGPSPPSLGQRHQTTAGKGHPCPPG